MLRQLANLVSLTCLPWTFASIFDLWGKLPLFYINHWTKCVFIHFFLDYRLLLLSIFKLIFFLLLLFCGCNKKYLRSFSYTWGEGFHLENLDLYTVEERIFSRVLFVCLLSMSKQISKEPEPWRLKAWDM